MPAKTPEARKRSLLAISARWGIPVEVMESWDPAERRREMKRRWYAANRDRMQAYFRTYYAEHPEIRERNRKVAAKRYQPRPRPTPTSAEKAQRHERKKAADATYRSENRERINAQIAAAKAAKPELYRLISRASAAARRSRLRSAPTERVDLRRVRARDLSTCHLCRRVVPGLDELSFDHLIPVVRDGAWAEWNLMVAHQRCNRKRGTRALFDPETKESALAYIASRIPQRSLPA